MINREIIKYIKWGISRGISLEELKIALLKRGQNSADIDDSISAMSVATPSSNNVFSNFALKNNSNIRNSHVSSIVVIALFVVLVVGLLFLVSDVNVVSVEDLEEGVVLEMKKSQVKLNYYNGKVENVNLIESTSDFAKMNIGADEIEFNKYEKKSLDLDDDGIIDVEMTYQGIKNDVPTFFIELYRSDFNDSLRNT